MISVSIDDSNLSRLLNAMGSQGRAALNHTAAYGLLTLCRKHLKVEASRRHASANRLGATPTGHLEEAARTMVSTADATAGEVQIFSPGFRRVFGSLSIKARNSRALTLPLDAASYGKRAGELRREGWQLFRSPAKGLRAILLGKHPGTGEVKALYLLRASVTLPQDRTLLPSDRSMVDAVRSALCRHLQAIQRKAR
ncbi:MAG: hypothetical protein ACI4RT_05340 [Candidatus Spyradenecus sp.]